MKLLVFLAKGFETIEFSAFIDVMGWAKTDFDCKIDRAIIHDGTAQIIGVASIEDACMVAKKLKANGIDCIELCSAFGEAGAKAIIEATGNTLPIGYITHLLEQDEMYRIAFSN